MDELDEIELQMFREELADIMNMDAVKTRDAVKDITIGLAIVGIGIAALGTAVYLIDRQRQKIERKQIIKEEPS